MIKLKMMINNDRKIPMHLRVQCASQNPWEGFEYTLAPSESKMVSFDAPEHTVPYLKIWETNFALLSNVLEDTDDLNNKLNESEGGDV
jgi:hypothetical protein